MYRSAGKSLINDLKNNFVAFVAYNGTVSRNWAGADTSDVTGCACSLLGTNPDGQTCRSDARSADIIDEGGVVTNLKKLPVSAIVYRDDDDQSSASITIGSFGCAPQPFG